MADPYHFPRTTPPKPPAISIMTVIGVLFAAFMVWQIATTIGESQAELAERTIVAGDTIEYDFTARLPDGRLFDTTVLDVARQANATEDFPLAAEFQYEPRQAVVDPAQPGLGWGPDIDARVVGAHAGQTIRFTVSGALGTGEWQTFTPDGTGIPREMQAQLFQRVVFLQEPAAAAEEGRPGSPGFNITQLDDTIGPLEVGGTYNAGRDFPPSWDLVFDDVNFDNKSLLFRHTVQDGQYFDVEALPGGVTVLIREDETRLVYRLDLEKGGVFVVEPQGGLHNAGFTPGSYRIADVNETLVYFEYHSGLDPSVVGQELHVELHIREKVVADDESEA